MPSKVSSLTVVPSAAAVIGSSTVQCRSSPRRWNVSCAADDDLDVEVARGAGAGADLALAGQLDAGAGVDAGGDPDLQRAAGADPAVAGALEAGVGDDRAVALAGGARAGGHHLAEERALHLLHLAAAAADVAGAGGGARLRAVAVAGARRRPRCRW